jgi:hypothetical protein
MPERLGADKKQKIATAHAEIIAALQQRGMRLSESEADRLRKKLGAYIGKSNPEHIDIPTLRDAIAEKINASPQARARWFQKAGLLHTLEEHARGSVQRAAELSFMAPLPLLRCQLTRRTTSRRFPRFLP